MPGRDCGGATGNGLDNRRTVGGDPFRGHRPACAASRTAVTVCVVNDHELDPDFDRTARVRGRRWVAGEASNEFLQPTWKLSRGAWIGTIALAGGVVLAVAAVLIFF